MVRKVRWSRSAKADLQQVFEFIGKDAPLTASRLADQMFEASESLRSMPDRGRIIPEFDDKSLREIFVSRFRVMYKVQPDEVIIIAIVHMSRDLLNMYSSEEE